MFHTVQWSGFLLIQWRRLFTYTMKTTFLLIQWRRLFTYTMKTTLYSYNEDDFSITNFLIWFLPRVTIYIYIGQMKLYITSWRAWRCPWKKIENNKFEFFLAYNTMSVHIQIQPSRSSLLAGYRQNIYTNVLFYYIDSE